MYKGIIKKSRTLDLSAALAVLGVIELNMPLVRDMLGDYYGVVFILFAAVGAYLRTDTTGKVGDK